MIQANKPFATSRLPSATIAMRSTLLEFSSEFCYNRQQSFRPESKRFQEDIVQIPHLSDVE